jgi:hypothetical protein
MRQEDTRRLLVTITGKLALVVAVLTLALLLRPEALRELLFSAEPRSPSGERDGWGWLALGWFALVGSRLILVVVAALLLPAVGKSPTPAATAPALFPRHSPADPRAASTRDHIPTTHDWDTDDSETPVTR